MDVFSIVGFVVLLVIVARQRSQLGRIERELGEVRKLVIPGAAGSTSRPAEALTTEPSPLSSSEALLEGGPDDVPQTSEPEDTQEIAAAGPWGSPVQGEEAVSEPRGEDGAAKSQEPKKKPDIETALGTRWAVWVGGIALALGGLFLVRYSIEAGIFGPGVRIAMAAILGLVLAGGGEFIRRTGFKVPVEGAAGAFIPAILTAAGAFTLFGTVYAAHGIYGFIGPTAAFVLLGLIGIATIAAALVHGQALAGVGLLGSLATPMLVSSQSPNPWALFGYLAIVLAATGFIARIRRWSLLMAAAFAGVGLWVVLYMIEAPTPGFGVLVFINLVVLAVLGFVWLGSETSPAEARMGFDLTSIAPAIFVAAASLVLFAEPRFADLGGAWPAALIVAAMIGTVAFRPQALPVLYGSALATVFAYLKITPLAETSIDLSGYAAIDTTPVTVVADAAMVRIGIVLGLLFLGTGLWSARRHVGTSLAQSASWAACAAAVPLVIVLSLWVTFGDIDRDFVYAAVTLLLLAVLVAGGEWIARAEQPPLIGGLAVSFALAGAGVATVVLLHMAFGSGLTTVLLGAAAVVPALATRWRDYPVLGWLSVGSVVAVLARIAFDPTIVGAEFLSRTPVFNWLLAGYGVPALGFGFAAWQLARTTNGRPRLAMEAGAALFALLCVAMLVRHAMHGGVIDDGRVSLAEQSIYTLIALGAGAILISIDMRSPSSVLRYGSLIVGVVSALAIVGQHFVILNPLFTDESTGRIPVFNLLFLAYLLPAAAAGAVAYYARGKRPKWYSAMLALIGALLAFAYATLSVRRFFKGEFIGLWSGMEQIETYSYSALWLLLGVVLLVIGVRFGSYVLRVASAALIAIAVLKVFLFDMSELEGVLRALSFIGLGAVLIGIGLFYQRLLSRAPRQG
ncbi:DUF2339 domain-containing protein [Mesorhizobium sp. UC74_2]|uniref:DUF2339 domain-containing protein n=1 Tax=Mesorhizobium sp. UC74_2 TaxID=3350171 RepID=UPI00366F875B